jgi:hypothetical protein
MRKYVQRFFIFRKLGILVGVSKNVHVRYIKHLVPSKLCIVINGKQGIRNASLRELCIVGK